MKENPDPVRSFNIIQFVKSHPLFGDSEKGICFLHRSGQEIVLYCQTDRMDSIHHLKGRVPVGLAYNPRKAVQVLSKADKKLGRLIKAVGPIQIDPPKRLNPFQALMRSIVYQQLSGKAAATIYGRVLGLFPGQRSLKPEQILEIPMEMLRGAGMSNAKARAVKDLAEKAMEGIVPTGARLRKMSDEVIVDRLTQVWGIGEWTVQMVLIFQLGRSDVLPVKDLGVRKGYMLTYGLDAMPEEGEMMDYCECWRPYRSVGSWYMWRAVDLYG